MFSVWKCCCPVWIYANSLRFLRVHQITYFLCQFWGEQQQQKPAWMQRCHAVQKLFVWFLFFLSIGVAGGTESTEYSSTCGTKFCFKWIRLKGANSLSNKSSISKRRHRKVKTELNNVWFILFCVDACPHIVLWTSRKKSRTVLESIPWW